MVLFYKILNRFYWFCNIGFRFILSKSNVFGSKDSVINIHKNVIIKKSRINLKTGSSLVIEEGTIIENINMHVTGDVFIGKNNIIKSASQFEKLSLVINGKVIIGNNNRIQSRILVRYGGELKIGDHNNINQESEIRADERITIGSFNQISYKVMIWDTNTHNIYNAEKRRNLAIDKFPIFGYEYEKPKTKPVHIGDDCWVGREAALLKGAVLSNKCILGFRTIISDFETQEGTTTVSQIEYKILNNNI